MNPAYLAALGNHLWQSSLFAGMAGLLTLSLKNNPARVRHWVWLVASWKFLIPFSVLMSLGGQIHWRTAPQSTQSAFSVFMAGVGQPFTVPAALPAPMSAAFPAAGHIPPASRIPALLGTIWACGFLGIGCSWWIRWWKIRAAVRAGSRVHLELPIVAVSSPTLLEPGIFGVFRPVMLLPEGILNRLTAPQLKAVIAHELSHVRHRDNLAAAIHMVVETVFWFHPLVWWMGKRMLEERERACDEEVLRLGTQPRVYAEGIVEVCRLYVESPLVCVAGVTGANLKRRIEAVMANRPGQRLNRTKRLLLASTGISALAGPIALGLFCSPPNRAQTPASQAFKVASIRVNRSGDRIMLFNPAPGGRFTAGNCTLNLLVSYAYDVLQSQISGAPDWVTSEHYDMAATAERDSSVGEIRAMLQRLLEDRFQLKSHWEARERTVYALVVSTPGKLKETSGDCPGILSDRTSRTNAAPDDAPCGALRNTPGNTKGYRLTAGQLAESLSFFMQKPVEDQTGLTARYDIELEWTPEAKLMPTLDPATAGPPSIFIALQEQLGLKLQSAKGPVRTLIVDHVARPSEN